MKQNKDTRKYFVLAHTNNGFKTTKEFIDYLKSFDSTPLQLQRRRERERLERLKFVERIK